MDRIIFTDWHVQQATDAARALVKKIPHVLPYPDQLQACADALRAVNEHLRLIMDLDAECAHAEDGEGGEEDIMVIIP